MEFFAIFGSQMGFFEGVKCALVVIHLKGCITTNLGGNSGENKRKMSEKKAKNKSVGWLTYLILGLFGIIWWPDCPQLVSNLI